MVNFDEIDEARKLLGLRNTATLKEIKNAYRRMAYRYHPDKNRADDSPEGEEIMKRLNRAYQILIEYCNNYNYRFKEEDVARTYPMDEYLRRYRSGWFDGI